MKEDEFVNMTEYERVRTAEKILREIGKPVYIDQKKYNCIIMTLNKWREKCLRNINIE